MYTTNLLDSNIVKIHFFPYSFIGLNQFSLQGELALLPPSSGFPGGGLETWRGSYYCWKHDGHTRHKVRHAFSTAPKPQR